MRTHTQTNNNAISKGTNTHYKQPSHANKQTMQIKQQTIKSTNETNQTNNHTMESNHENNQSMQTNNANTQCEQALQTSNHYKQVYGANKPLMKPTQTLAHKQTKQTTAANKQINAAIK